MEGSDRYISSSDEEILGPLKQDLGGRRKAEELLFQKHLYFIREGMSKYRLTEEQAFDAYSDTILSALQTIAAGSFESRSSLKTYLFRIFSNKCVDVLRKTSTNKNTVHQAISITGMFSQLSDNAKTIVQQLMEKADHDLLKKRLNELGEKCKELLMLSADGNSDKVLAIQLDYKTASVVKTSRLRCMERLRQLYRKNK